MSRYRPDPGTLTVRVQRTTRRTVRAVLILRVRLIIVSQQNVLACTALRRRVFDQIAFLRKTIIFFSPPFSILK